MTAPKRFYKEVSLAERGDAFAVTLDGKVAKTTGRAELAAPKALADRLREEWDAQAETIELDTMPLTRLHGFVLDAGEKGHAEFVETITSYAGSDLLCYRAEDTKLAVRQEQLFAPFLERAKADGFEFQVTSGILPVEQPRETIAAIEKKLSGTPTKEVFPRKLLTEITGSAILGLYADQDPENAFAAARLDEAFQAESWGRDAEAEAREALLRRDYDDVLTYLTLVS